MPLTLRIQSYRKEPPAAPVERRFDHLGGTIGRAAANDLALPDPAKYISRNHGRIDFTDGRYTLTDLGANPSWINDRPLGTGKTAPLAHGDRLLIGDYELAVTIDEPTAAPPADVPLFAPETSAALPFQPQPAAAPSPWAGPSFDELRDTLAEERILDAAGAGHAATALAAPSASDPLGLGLLDAQQAPVIMSREPLFRGSEPDHVAPQFHALPGARVASPAPDVDARWLPPPEPTIMTSVAALHGGAAPRPAQAAAPRPAAPQPIPDDYDPLADFLPPPSRNTASMPATQAPVGSGDVVLRALLRGMGVPGLRPVGTPEETAELAGAILREAIAGTMSVLLARAMTKRENRLDMTVLGVGANNPLKFFPDAESALAQLLTGAMAGYMTPLKSVANAFDDLRAHELAMVAGMRAALAGVLARVDPALIEARVEPGGVFDRMRSTKRKARMWDAMVALYGDIVREADDDFGHLFGDRFAEAYAEQVERLRHHQEQS
ncbi:type VI secretion system-associated FHA domain protein TagH [Pseudoduganella plicata]|uniref:Phosphopeptide-binding protein n=1 Tax=Pseudoduganella plicata TaxID=321984 RepID=A0A4P7B971_9BURK|nr:type VI secretion system-associated FHA domain protein TagH [Pseudoduganella plicata]QBQ35046.1 type VI secretion system-associated FHA domain protein TagH [Pseudoduganella plicata]GGZ07075.1 phosphopeptide-binding protein [Pseudoduganella plicata]